MVLGFIPCASLIISTHNYLRICSLLLIDLYVFCVFGRLVGCCRLVVFVCVHT